MSYRHDFTCSGDNKLCATSEKRLFLCPLQTLEGCKNGCDEDVELHAGDPFDKFKCLLIAIGEFPVGHAHLV